VYSDTLHIGHGPFDMILLAPPESADHKWGRPKWEMRGSEPSSSTIAGPSGLEGYSVCVCVCVCVRARALVCVRVKETERECVLRERER